MKYIQNKDFNDINSYCKSRCKKIINEHCKTTIQYYRGMYKGYMYGITITTHFINAKVKITHSKLYYIIKEEKNKIQLKYIKDRDVQKGLIESLYDLMNFLSNQKG